MTNKAHFSSVFIRKYIYQFVIFLLCLVFLTVLSFSVCEKATENYEEKVRYETAELNEIVFSTQSGYTEPFYSFGGSAYAFTSDGHRINTDVFMTLTDVSYEKNPLFYKGGLPAGGCAVSENLTFKFGLSVGDTLCLKVGSNERSFDYVISEILPAQSGVDSKYMHEGVIILSENTDFVNEGKHIFTAFVKDWDREYLGLVEDPARGSSVVFTKEIVEAAKGKLITYALLSVLATWIFIAACEILIFSKMGKKYKDYSLLCSYGISKRGLFGTVFKDHCIKYLFPLLINFLIWLTRLWYYHNSYAVPALTYLGLIAITVVALTFITVMRKNRCPKIRR